MVQLYSDVGIYQVKKIEGFEPFQAGLSLCGLLVQPWAGFRRRPSSSANRVLANIVDQ
jgi:hypothetical protein